MLISEPKMGIQEKAPYWVGGKGRFRAAFLASAWLFVSKILFVAVIVPNASNVGIIIYVGASVLVALVIFLWLMDLSQK